MRSVPFSFDCSFSSGFAGACDTHLVRKLSDLRECFADRAAYSELLGRDDAVAYEVYEIRRPEAAGEMLSGYSIVHPGLVGEEFFLTKGHYHAVRDTAEFYFCLKGHGMLVMEDAEGAWAVEEMGPGRAVYVTPGWAHRSVNLSLDEDFVTFFVYPANAGHDYATIRKTGFRKRVVLRDGRPQVIDDPRWEAARAARSRQES